MSKPLILIADPNNDRAGTIETALDDDLEVLRVRDVEHAFAEAKGRRPAAVVLDFPFPMNGSCLSVALRDHPDTTEIPVVAFSAWDFPRTRGKAMEYGCRVFVPHGDGAAAVARAVGELLEAEAVG